MCNTDLGLTLDGDNSSSTYNECICNTSIDGINRPTAILSLKISILFCDSVGYNGEYNVDSGCTENNVVVRMVRVLRGTR